MRPDLHLDIGSQIKSDVSAFSGAATGAATGTPSTISVAGKVQDSADGSTGWNDVTGAAITPVVIENGTAKVNVILRGCQAYIRAVVTPSFTGGSSPAIPAVGILILGGNSEAGGVV